MMNHVTVSEPSGQEIRRKRQNTGLEEMSVRAFRIPTDRPEADGTLAWDDTTLITVSVGCDGVTGYGYSYGHASVAGLIQNKFFPLLKKQDPFQVFSLWERMRHEVRNDGQTGLISMGISAVDTALWDLKARLLNLPLTELWGAVRNRVPVYGSGGFLTYSKTDLQEQVRGWMRHGIQKFKIKIGCGVRTDYERTAAVREAIPDSAEIFVDANGAFTVKEALLFAQEAEFLGVRWFEEPIRAERLEDLRLIRTRVPAGMNIAAGEYGYGLSDFLRLLQSAAVDVLQIDVTRAGGFTGFLKAAALAEAFHIPVSTHTAPSLHLHLGCSVNSIVHLEYFHDHVRIEEKYFDGFQKPEEGALAYDPDRPGTGLVPRYHDLESNEVH